VVRGKKGVTQDQLAELAGLNRVHLYRIETGRQSMTLRTLKLIADALDVKMRDLIATSSPALLAHLRLIENRGTLP
jgi:transcriptional regulator with XRE-family HTH domain